MNTNTSTITSGALFDGNSSSSNSNRCVLDLDSKPQNNINLVVNTAAPVINLPPINSSSTNNLYLTNNNNMNVGATVNNLVQSTTQNQNQNQSHQSPGAIATSSHTLPLTANNSLQQQHHQNMDPTHRNNNNPSALCSMATNNNNSNISIPVSTMGGLGFESNLNTIINITANNDSDNNNDTSSTELSSVIPAIAHHPSVSRSRSSGTADPLTAVGAEMTRNNNEHVLTLSSSPGQSLPPPLQPPHQHHHPTLRETLSSNSCISVAEDCQSVRWPSTSANSVSNPPTSTSTVILSSQAHDPKSISTISYPESESIELEFKPLAPEDVDLLDFDSSLGCDNKSNNFSDNYTSGHLNLTMEPSPTGQADASFLDFELNCSPKEIAQVLETFNAILENEEGLLRGDFEFTVNDLNLNLQPIKSSECVQLVDNFTNLLIGGEDEEDLLIVVDDDGGRSSDFHRKLKKENSQALSVASGVTSTSQMNAGGSCNCGGEDDGESTEENNVAKEEDVDDDDDYYDTESNYPDYPYYPDGGEDIEGYESDRPMVRASMRKLRPVQMLPMPSSSSAAAAAASSSSASHSNYTIPENSSPQHRNLHSPVANNRLLVTSLINNLIMSEGGSSGGASGSGEAPTGTSGDSHSSNNYRQCSSVINEVSNPMYGEVGVVGSGRSSAGQGQSSSAIESLHLPRNISVATLGSSSSGTLSSGQASSSSGTSSEGSTSGSATSGSTLSSSSSGPANSSNNNNNNAPDITSATNGSSESNNTADSTTGDNATEVNGSSSATGTGTGTSTAGATAAATATTTATTAGRTTGRTSPLLGPGLRMPAGKWPHRLSSVLALIGCTLGLNNICRFSLLSVEYGANFILQFLFLSLVFGIPLFTFHMSIGQYLSSGIIDMWRISPIFQGIGIGLVVSQALIGIYTAVGVSWVFIYFRDSFITRYDQYRWGKCFRDYRDTACDTYLPLSNLTNFSQSVPDYFNGVVLQRGSPSYPTSSTGASSLKFTVAFNLAVVWMLVFVSLSKGLKSYGKVVHGFVLIPVASLLVLASKMVGLVPSDQTSSLFGQTAWSNFFFNSQTWVVAAREAFFTWGLLGACVMQVTSHNRFTHRLKSDASIVVLITTFVLLLSAFLGNACYSVILSHGYTYSPSSFESDKTYTFLSKTPSVHPPDQPSTEPYNSQHISFLMGVRILKPDAAGGGVSVGDGNYVSGYQSLRLATELFPTTMAMLSHTGLSPFWTVLFYFTFILFGIAQQIAIWHCVIRGVIAIKSKVLRSWEITITFCVCAMGFVLGLPLCTELGIFIEYFMDYAIGSGWWIMVLYLLELVAVFIVRGAPYCGENIVTVLMTGRGRLVLILAPLLSFVWNVILPVAMLVLTIASFKSGNVRELYDWNPNHGYGFWPSWTKELGSLIQLLPILAVPLVAIVQSCRYLSSGPPDLFDRMQQLYRPNSRGVFGRSLSAHLQGNTPATDFPSPASDSGRSEDPPPKYTPPPSYSTATGAKIAKFLRQSMRRSMRRFGVGPSTSNANADLPPPPNYASVILEISAQQQQQLQLQQAQQLAASTSEALGSSNPKNSSSSGKIYHIPLSQTLGRSLGESKERASLRRIASDITPRDIARILRTSFRRGSSNNHGDSEPQTQSPDDLNQIFTTASSAQTLAVPIPVSGLSTFQNNLNYNNITSLHLTGHPLPAPAATTAAPHTSHPPPHSTFHLESDLEFLRVPIVPGKQPKSKTSTVVVPSSSSGDVNYNVDNNNSTNNISINTNSVSLTLPHRHSSNFNSNNINNNSSSSSIYPSNSNSHDTFSFVHRDRDRDRDRSHTRSRSSGGSLFMAAQSHNRGNSDTTDSQLTLISHSSSQNDLSNLMYNNLDSSCGNYPAATATAIDFRLGGIVNPGFQFSHLNLNPNLPHGSGNSGGSSNNNNNHHHHLLSSNLGDEVRQPASSSEA